MRLTSTMPYEKVTYWFSPATRWGKIGSFSIPKIRSPDHRLQSIRHVFGMKPAIPRPDLHEPSAAPQAANPTRRDPAENVTMPQNTDFQVGQHVKYFTSDGTFDAVVEIKKVHTNDFPHYYTVSRTYQPETKDKQPKIGSKPLTHLTPLNPLGPDQSHHQMCQTGQQQHHHHNKRMTR